MSDEIRRPVDPRVPLELCEDIILNRIRTPDGTEITSTHVHDYKEHRDVNGQLYAVDGGNEYLRRIGGGDYVDLSVSMGSHTLEELVKIVTWGSYGKTGKGPLKKIPIADMESSHINTVLATQQGIRECLEFLMRWELARRTREANAKIYEVISEFKDA
jgi:hypothetical protein